MIQRWSAAAGICSILRDECPLSFYIISTQTAHWSHETDQLLLASLLKLKYLRATYEAARLVMMPETFKANSAVSIPCKASSPAVMQTVLFLPTLCSSFHGFNQKFREESFIQCTGR